MYKLVEIPTIYSNMKKSSGKTLAIFDWFDS